MADRILLKSGRPPQPLDILSSAIRFLRNLSSKLATLRVGQFSLKQLHGANLLIDHCSSQNHHIRLISTETPHTSVEMKIPLITAMLLIGLATFSVAAPNEAPPTKPGKAIHTKSHPCKTFWWMIPPVGLAMCLKGHHDNKKADKDWEMAPPPKVTPYVVPHGDGSQTEVDTEAEVIEVVDEVEDITQ